MTRKIQFLLIILVLALILPFGAYAHPGRTNASGCHVCKTNCKSWGLKNGKYHCHAEKVKKAKVEAKVKAKIK
ncbi:MAG: YHYH domain-containing protein [Candidatus Parcubacteria bacterium]|nr:YHYH domain-containing protein [Candidatus Parcubacteria bacterium]